MCLRCQAYTGPSLMGRFLAKGSCSGPPLVRRNQFLLEKSWAGGRLRVQKNAIFLDMLIGLTERMDYTELPASEGTLAPSSTAPGNRIHVSHQLLTREAWTWCRHCGSYTRGLRIRRLGEPCRTASNDTKAALKRIKTTCPRAPKSRCGAKRSM